MPDRCTSAFSTRMESEDAAGSSPVALRPLFEDVCNQIGELEARIRHIERDLEASGGNRRSPTRISLKPPSCLTILSLQTATSHRPFVHLNAEFMGAARERSISSAERNGDRCWRSISECGRWRCDGSHARVSRHGPPTCAVRHTPATAVQPTTRFSRRALARTHLPLAACFAGGVMVSV